LAELVTETLANQPPARGDKQYLSTKLERVIETATTNEALRVDLDFFENPAALPLLLAIERILTDWLHRFCLLSFSEPDAASVAKRLPSYFAVALHDEWRSDEATYKPLPQALTGPFAKAVLWEQEWERYRLSLIKQFASPVFEERFPLSAIYVPLRAAHLATLQEAARPGSPASDRSGRLALVGDRQGHTVVLDLEEAVHQWLGRADRSDTLRLIRGGPGSGKSTFAKKLAASLAEQRTMRVLFFPLQHFRISGKLLDAIGEALGELGTAAFTENPVEQPQFATPDRPLLMIFDGLDELAQPGRVADEQTREFLGELRFFLDRWSTTQCRVFGLVTGRTAVVQASRDVLKLAEHQELEVLPFLVSESAIKAREASRYPFQDPKKRLACDQRELWWRNYATCKAGEPAEMPAVLKAAEVADLSAEPLLLYLIVLSGYHRRPEQAETVNRNAIYDDLFRGVAERRHAGNQPLAARTELQKDFDEVMEIIATAAWYGDGRTATVEEIRRWCPDHLNDTLERFLANEAGVARLIAAFYFQRTETGKRRRDAIAFTHKSFGEYLTARRLVRSMAEIDEELTKGSRRYGEAQALEEWFDLTHHAAMDFDLLRFIRDEIRLCHQQAADWQATLCRLLDRSIRDGMPVKLSDEVTFRIGERYARNAEEALLVMLNGCAVVTEKISKLTWPQPRKASDFINRLQLQREAGSVSLMCLSYVDLSRQRLPFQTLVAADLRGADLSNTNLIGANLISADLTGANLSGARLIGADLRGVHLRGGDPRGTDPCGTDLINILINTYLNGYLIGAYHGSADLSDVHLRGPDTNLTGANLSGADLTGANLSGANLQGADLSDANLRSADLTGADLIGANLHGADLDQATLMGANLVGADLSDADLRSADLTGVNLDGVRGNSKTRIPDSFRRPTHWPSAEPIEDKPKTS
jgi:uncharacterized protein YjbI with pentapeptide repeats